MNRANRTARRVPAPTLLALVALALGLLLGAARPAAAETFEEVDGGEAGAVTEAEARELVERDPAADGQVPAKGSRLSSGQCQELREWGWEAHELMLAAANHKNWSGVYTLYEESVGAFRAWWAGGCNHYGSPYQGSPYA